MKNVAFGALLAGLLVACGGDDTTIKVVDGQLIDEVGVCNPLTQAGCPTGQKCTWLVDVNMGDTYSGHVGCAPDGTAAAGEACMFGMPGAAGYDNCKAGTVCGNYRGGAGVCKSICDANGGTPDCGNTHVCVTYSGLFSTGENSPPAGGVCDLACDPIEDNDFDGSGALTKTKNTCSGGSGVGCYGYPSFGTPPKTGWSCTSDINFQTNQAGNGLRHRVQCTVETECADPGPRIYVNSCNQGYLPLLYEASGVMTVICTAMCKPATAGCSMGACGTQNADRNGGQDESCQTSDRMGSFNGPNMPSGGEHCEFLWSFEISQNGDFLRSATSDTLGFCVDHGKYRYDSTGDGMITNADALYPDCATLPGGVGSGSALGAGDFGCQPSSAVGLATGKVPAEFMKKRAMMERPRLLYNRTMGTN